MYTQKVFNITDLRRSIYKYKNDIEIMEKENELMNDIKSSLRETYDIYVDNMNEYRKKSFIYECEYEFILDKKNIQKIMFLFKNYYNKFDMKNIKEYFNDVIDIYNICGNGNFQFDRMEITLINVTANNIIILKDILNVYYKCKYKIEFDYDSEFSESS